MKVYHLVLAPVWQAAVAAGTYAPPSLQSEGFIHLSFDHQVAASANRHYADADGLLVITFDAEAFGDHLVIEDTSGHGEFPHVYAPIDPTGARSVDEMPRDETGAFELPS